MTHPVSNVPEALTQHVLRASLITPHAVRAAAETGLLRALRAPGRTIDELLTMGFARSGLVSVTGVLQQYGIVVQSDDRFLLSDQAAAFLTDNAIETMRSTAFGSRIELSAEELQGTLLSGESAYLRKNNRDFWSDLSINPTLEAEFHDNLERICSRLAALTATVLDLSNVTTLVDVGGGRGVFAEVICNSVQGIRATVFDKSSISAATLEPRFCRGDIHYVTGDFFADELPPADMYVLCQVLHDWNDADASRILSNVRKACRPGSQVLIIDRGPGGPNKRPSRYAEMSLRMFVLFGSAERSAGEVRALAETAGFDQVDEPIYLDDDFQVLRLSLRVSAGLAETTLVDEKVDSTP